MYSSFTKAKICKSESRMQLGRKDKKEKRVQTHKNIYNGKKDENAIKNKDKSSGVARVM